MFAQKEFEYEETTISMKIPKVGVVESPAYIRDNILYLPVIDIFTFLKIQNTPSPGYDSVSGFFLNENSNYLIDRAHNKIYYQKKVFELQEGDIIRTETNMYLRSDYFGKVFGMNISFDFNEMLSSMSTDFELPVIREMRMEQMRRDLPRLKGEIKADTVIGRKYPIFHFGVADWSLAYTQKVKGMYSVLGSLTLGSVIAGGEADVSFSYRNQQDFSMKQLYYLWHYANNDRPVLRQVKLGRISPAAVSSIYAPLDGIQLTNTPTTYRQSFGSYTLTDYTEPGWLVELYVNNVLVDYLKADASGFFTFEVPLVYGNSSVLLRFYGPWGEERSREKSIIIPFNFIPLRKLEYTFSAAMVEDKRNSLFSRANFNYGLSRRVTIGGGAEYLSSVRPNSLMPFFNFSLRLASSLLLTGEYSFGVRFKGVLSYRLPKNIQVELLYFKYQEDQKTVTNSFLEQRKIMISVPVRGQGFSSLVRFSIDQVLMHSSRDLNAELLMSGNVLGVNVNITTTGLFYDPSHPYIYGVFSLGFNLPARFVLTPQAQYDYTHNRLINLKADVERQVFKNGVLRLSYEHNFAFNVRNVQFGLRYVFPFAQAGISGMVGNRSTSFVQSASGSLMVDAKNNWVGPNSISNVGKGGLVLIPFLDLNVNGKRDQDEPKVNGLNLHVTGGRVISNKQDSTIRVFDLEPFTSCFIEIDKTSFDNIAWQVRNPLISVAVDPNQFKLVEIPVAVYGEASGMVYLKKEDGLMGQGRVFVSFYRNDSVFAGRTTSESDGYFNYFGLPPGDYYAIVDTVQSRILNMSVSPAYIPITILKNRVGDVAGGINFVLQKKSNDSTGIRFTSPIKTPEPDTVEQPRVKAIQGHPQTDTSGYTIQVAGFRNQTSAINAEFRLQSFVNLPVSLEFESGFYYLRIHGIIDIESARQLLINISANGFPDASILKK
jgi:hypothetical protein